jgi:hypothetical protein
MPVDTEYAQLLAQLLADPANATIREALYARYVEISPLGGTSTDGYPYPVPTDPVAQGADAIRALAEALNGRTFVSITANKPNAAAVATAYPVATSLMYLTSSEAQAGGWPSSTYSIVETLRTALTTIAVQYVHVLNANGGPPTLYYRTGNTTVWSAWAPVYLSTAWMPITAASGFSASYSSVKKVGEVLYYAGVISGTFAANTVVTIVPAGGVPAGYRPSRQMNRQLAANSAGATVRGIIDETGLIQVATGSTAPTYVDISGFSGTVQTLPVG